MVLPQTTHSWEAELAGWHVGDEQGADPLMTVLAELNAGDDGSLHSPAGAGGADIGQLTRAATTNVPVRERLCFTFFSTFCGLGRADELRKGTLHGFEKRGCQHSDLELISTEEERGGKGGRGSMKRKGVEEGVGPRKMSPNERSLVIGHRGLVQAV
eukprot:32892-Rhodomonas_salina.1